MKKTLTFKSIIALVSIIFAVSILFTACGSSSTDSTANPTSSAAPEAASISGSITVAGSTALQPLAQKAADLFMEKNADAKIQVQGGGSGTGLTQVSEGTIDIGNSDLFAADKLKDGKDKDLVDHKVCVVGFATVVNPEVKVDNLSKQQLIDIFTGKITNWKDVGGDDLGIVIINRPASSGTRATFKKFALDGADEASGKALTEDASGTVAKTVAETKGAISYLALSYLKGDTTMKVLKYENTEATADNIKSGKYPIWSYEHMYTKGEATGLAKAFLDYMSTDDVKALISDLGYIATSDMAVSR